MKVTEISSVFGDMQKLVGEPSGFMNAEVLCSKVIFYTAKQFNEVIGEWLSLIYDRKVVDGKGHKRVEDYVKEMKESKFIPHSARIFACWCEADGRIYRIDGQATSHAGLQANKSYPIYTVLYRVKNKKMMRELYGRQEGEPRTRKEIVISQIGGEEAIFEGITDSNKYLLFSAYELVDSIMNKGKTNLRELCTQMKKSNVAQRMIKINKAIGGMITNRDRCSWSFVYNTRFVGLLVWMSEFFPNDVVPFVRAMTEGGLKNDDPRAALARLLIMPKEETKYHLRFNTGLYAFRLWKENTKVKNPLDLLCVLDRDVYGKTKSGHTMAGGVPVKDYAQQIIDDFGGKK